LGFDDYYNLLAWAILFCLFYLLLDLLLTPFFQRISKRIKGDIGIFPYLTLYFVLGALLEFSQRWDDVPVYRNTWYFSGGICGVGSFPSYLIYFISVPLLATVFYIWGRVRAKQRGNQMKVQHQTAFYVSIPIMILGIYQFDYFWDTKKQIAEENYEQTTFKYSVMEMKDGRNEKQYPSTPWPNRPTEIEE